MEKSNHNISFFNEKNSLEKLDKSELISQIMQFQRHQEVLAEIIPLLIQSKDIDHDKLNELLKHLGEENKISVGLYTEMPENDSFGLIGSYKCKTSPIEQFPLFLRLHEHPEMLVELLTTKKLVISDDDVGVKEAFFKLFCKEKNGHLLIIPAYAAGNTYGFFAIGGDSSDLNSGLITSLFSSLALVFAQFLNRKKLIDHNEKMLHDVEKANQIKTAFLTNISHEIRTPVNAIVGFSDLLADPDLTIDQREEFISLITESSRTLVKMFDNIIDASKLRSKQIQFRKEWIEITQLMSEVQTEVSYLDKNDKILFDLESPDDHTDIQFFIDTYRFKQIAKNLIENSYKFTNEGKIVFGHKIEANNLIFYVKDTGSGIAEDIQDHIFEYFSHIDQSFTKESGKTGLGLSIAKELTEQLGGTMWFDTEIEVGSTFYFSFPKKLYSISKKKKKEESQMFPAWNTHTILIAEDVEFNFMYLREILTPTGATIVWAKNGREAVDFVTKKMPSLILMDLQMPEMNGYEATKAIRKIYPDLPIVVQTAFSMADEEQKCFETGCSDFLAKPIRAKQLIKTIKKYI